MPCITGFRQAIMAGFIRIKSDRQGIMRCSKAEGLSFPHAVKSYVAKPCSNTRLSSHSHALGKSPPRCRSCAVESNARRRQRKTPEHIHLPATQNPVLHAGSSTANDGKHKAYHRPARCKGAPSRWGSNRLSQQDAQRFQLLCR